MQVHQDGQFQIVKPTAVGLALEGSLRAFGRIRKFGLQREQAVCGERQARKACCREAKSTVWPRHVLKVERTVVPPGFEAVAHPLGGRQAGPAPEHDPCPHDPSLVHGCKINTLFVGKGMTADENQLHELRTFAARKGYAVYKEYTDQDSGGNADRPQFKQLFQDAHQGCFDVVLFWALDRFSREGVGETLNYLQKLSASGVHFLSFTEQYLDSTGIFKDAIVGILAAIAKQEKVRLGERTKAGLDRVREKGKVIGRPTIDAEKVAHVKRLKATGISDRAIATALGMSPSTVAKYLAA